MSEEGAQRLHGARTGRDSVEDDPAGVERKLTVNDVPFSSTVQGLEEAQATLEGAGPLTPTPLPVGQVGSVGELPTVLPNHFHIRREIARGGLGVILEARDRVLDRTVVIKRGLRSNDAANARFIREALITARLQHPSIVPVYEAGRWPGGEPFYAMKLVSGRPLTTIIQDGQSLDERLAMLPNIIAVADAIAYAHGQRIIHRDLKPDNILVGEFGETVVIDWGLAKDLASDDDELDFDRDTQSLTPYAATLQGLTVDGAIMGTPEYMAPEQARGQDVDERTDVYALGGVLYHVLAGQAPFVGATKQAVIDQVIASAPPPLDPRIPRDLSTIVKKAMARDPVERYRTAKELAEDLRRFQTGQLVSARGYTRWQLFGRWARRNRASLVTLSSALVLLLVVAGVAVTNVIRERNVATQERNAATQERAIAQQARATAERRNNELILVQARSKVERDPTTALAWLKSYPVTAPNWEDAYEVAIDAAQRGVAKHVFLHAKPRWLGFASRDVLVSGEASDRKIRSWDLAAGRAIGAIDTRLPTLRLALSPDGKAVAFALDDGTIHFAALPAGTPRQIMKLSAPSALAFSPDGALLAATGAGGAVLVHDLAAARTRELVGHRGVVATLAFSADGKLLATAGADRVVRLWTLATGAHRTLHGHTDFVNGVGFAPDGLHLASASEDRTMRVWSLASPGAPARVLAHDDPLIDNPEYTPDGSLLLARDAKAVSIWRSDGALVQRLPVSGFDGAALSAAASILVAASADGGLQALDLQSGDARSLLGDVPNLFVAASADGSRVAAIGRDYMVRVCDRPQRRSRTFRGHESSVVDVAFAPDGRTFATASEDRTVRLWDVTTRESRILRGHDNSVFALAYAPDGQHLVSLSYGRIAYLWSIATGEARALPHGADLIAARFTHDGRSVITATRGGDLVSWDVASGAARSLVASPAGAPASPRGFWGRTFDISPDNTRIVSAATDGSLVIWSVSIGEPRVLGHVGYLDGATFVSNDHVITVANARNHHRVQLWDLARGTHQTLYAPKGTVSTHTLSRDGKWFALAEDNAIQLVELATHKVTLLEGHPELTTIRSLRFSHDGAHLASGASDGTVRLWHIASGASQIAHRHDGSANRVEFSSDGTLLLSASNDTTAWLGAVVADRSLPRDPSVLLRTIIDMTTAQIDDKDRAVTPTTH